ncbi:MAG: hypothetical protein HZA09_07540 [Nitrospirae bacterium]|nr:hypothetical protein [Nitrospirota bacterium]
MQKIERGKWSKILVSLIVLVLSLNQSVFGRENTPRFMVLIDEKSLGSYNIAEAEKVITEYLISKGIDVVDAELIKTNIDRDKALQSMMAGPMPAAALGLQFGAEVIIIGKAIAKGSAENIKDTSFRSYQASVSLKAIRTDTAEVLAVESNDAAKIHVDDVAGGALAIREATTPLITSMIQKVVGRLGDPSKSETQRIQLVVGDVQQVWQVVALKKLLQEKVKGMKDVIQRSFVSGIAIFDVLCSCNSQGLAEELTLS